jgi:hypothetical protein
MTRHNIFPEKIISYMAPCPVKGCNGKHDVTLLVRGAMEQNERQYAGPWYCKECGRGIRWEVSVPDITGGQVEVVGIITEESKIEQLVLLKLNKDCQDLHLVVRGMRFPPRDKNIEAERYYYEQHTCPTNYLTQAEVVILDKEDADPHGIFEYIAATDLDDELKAHICDIGAYAIHAYPGDWENALINLNARTVLGLFEGLEDIKREEK